MQTEITLKDQLSQARKSVREQKKELNRLKNSRNATKDKCKDLTKALKLQKLRLKETQESRDRWKQDYKKGRKETEELTQINNDQEALLGLKGEELRDLRTRIAAEKKSP